jgi:hypothetical protein
VVGTQLTFFALHAHQHQVSRSAVLSSAPEGGAVLHETSEACAICVAHTGSQAESALQAAKPDLLHPWSFLVEGKPVSTLALSTLAFQARGPPAA